MASRSEAFHPLPPVPPAVFWSVMGGTAAAMLDLAVAAAYWGARGVAPDRIFQSIAAWLLGPAAFTGGEGTVALGAVLYAGVLSAVMGAYRLLARRLPMLRRRPFGAGAVYGASMYGLTFLVFVPHFSAATPATHAWQWHAVCVAAYVLLVGIPAALLARIQAR